MSREKEVQARQAIVRFLVCLPVAAAIFFGVGALSTALGGIAGAIVAVLGRGLAVFVLYIGVVSIVTWPRLKREAQEQ